MRSTLAVLCLVLPLCATAQTPPSDPPAATDSAGPAAPMPAAASTPESVPAEPAPAPAAAAAEPAPAPAAAAAEPAPPPPPLPESCRSLTDKGMAADLKAVTAQAQKLEATALVQLYSASEGWWVKAVELCDGRSKERAQRNLAESQKASAILSEQLGNAPECGAAHKDAATLQDLARAALGERRWIDAATLFHKADDMWDLAAERCTGTQKEIAIKRQEQSEIDGYNAEFCAPLFERAREQTQKLRASSAGLSREEKQDGLMVAETLWRDALAQCKGAAAQESARNNAQTLARERGTPWVPRAPANTAAPPAAVPPKPTVQVAKPAVVPPPAPIAPATTPKPPAPIAMSSNKASAVAALPDLDTPAPSKAAAAVLNTSSTSAQAASAPVSAALVATAAASPAIKAVVPTREPEPPAPQPSSFAVGDMRFEGLFVRDLDAPTYSGSGKLTWSNGDVFEGTLKNGKRHGKGSFVWSNGQRYKGDWVEDVPSGQAVVDFANGNHYEGLVENSIPKGAGMMHFASGDTYRGTFAAGEPHGKGVYIWKNGQKYDGDWKNGKPNGLGRLQYADGDVYEGTVSDGSPSQSGTFTWVNGDRYVGQWKAGRKEGKGVFTWSTGDRWEGIYEDDVQTSNGALIRKSP